MWLSAIIAIVFFFAIFLGLAILIFFDLPHFGRTFPRFQEAIAGRAQALLHSLEESLGTTLSTDPFEELRTLPIRPIVMGAARSSIRFLSEFLLIFFFAIILLLGKYRFVRKISPYSRGATVSFPSC